MDSDKIRVLLVEDNPTDALIVKSELASMPGSRFSVVHVEQLKDAQALLEKQRFDVALLDLSLPDSHGFETFTRLHYTVPDIPVIVLSGRADEELAVNAVQAGAQDYLVKGHTTEDVLPRAIRYAIERQRSQKDLRAAHAQLARTNENLWSEIAGHELAEQSMRETEEKFRQIAENINEVFWLKDVQKARGEVLYISPGYERVWGRPCQELYDSPSSWTGAIHPDDCERILSTAGRQVSGTYDEQFRIIRPDGAERWIRSRAFPVKEEDGVVRRVVVVAEDVTEHKLMESQFHQSQKMEAMGTLAGGIAHDFNNILAAILGNATLAMLDLENDHPLRKSLTEIEKAGQRAKDLVQQILTFSPQHQQARQVMSLGPVLDEAVGLLRSTLPAGVELAIKNAPHDVNIMGDSTQIHQVVLNLCMNAWHALEGNSGRITVRLEVIALNASQSAALNGIRPGDYACLSVSDTGKGMDAPTLKRIFEPFFTTKPVGQGSGLGLSSVHGIVQNHDGAIKAVSQPNQGATFSLYFPLVQQAAEVRTLAEPIRVSSGHGQHILYLDDEEQLVDLAKRWLERVGYRVTGFTNPAECLRAFRETPEIFDLVITDLNMPGFSGLQVAGEMLKLRPELPVILSSGHVTEDLCEGAMSLGIRQVIYKPNTVKELSDTISRFAAAPQTR